MTRRFRFGIVGCGVIAQTHAEAIASLADAQLVAVADTTIEKAENLARRYDVHSYASLPQMLAQEQLDVVNVCTPSGLHAEHACQAMLAGCHVIVEKPMEIARER